MTGSDVPGGRLEAPHGAPPQPAHGPEPDRPLTLDGPAQRTAEALRLLCHHSHEQGATVAANQVRAINE